TNTTKPTTTPQAPQTPETPTIWTLTAKNPTTLRHQAQQLHTHLTTHHPHTHPTHIATALTHTRTHHPHRTTLTGTTTHQLLTTLHTYAQGAPDNVPDQVVQGQVSTGRTAFLFPGQGTQHPGMTHRLAATHPVYAEALAACAEALAPHTDWSLDEVLAGAPGAPPLDRVDVVQPALWAVMVSLAALWRHHGVRPDAVVGHSQGEIAAACVAGGLGLADGARVVALRSRALRALEGRGGMVSVTAPHERLAPLLAPWGDRVSVAAVNGPSSSIVSGEPAALEGLLEACAEAGVWARRVRVDYASHSPQVEELRERLTEDLAPIAPRAGEVRFHSTVSAGELATTELDGGYWFRNLRGTVRFEETVRDLLARGYTRFVEVSPHPALGVAVEQIVEATEGAGERARVISTLHRDADDAERFLAALGEAWTHGAPVDWGTLYDPAHAHEVSLPTYAFQKERFWPTPRAPRAQGASVAGASHPLVAVALQRAEDAGWLFTGRVSRADQPWLVDHSVHGTVLMPGTAFVDLAARVGELAGCPEVAELTLEEPLVLADDGAVELQTTLGPPDEHGRRPLAVHSRPVGAADGAEGGWTRHAGGLLIEPSREPDAPLAAEVWPPPGARQLPVAGHYAGLAERGFGYGPTFQGLRAAWRHADSVLAEIELDAEAGDFGIHPALLDAAFHAWLTELGGSDDEASSGAWLPFAWSGVRLARTGATRLRVTLTVADGEGRGAVRMSATDETGAPVVSVASVVARPVSRARLASLRAPADALFRLDWTAPEGTAGAAPVALAVLGDGEFTDLGAELGAGLARHGDPAALAKALDEGSAAPDAVLVRVDGPVGEAPHEVLRWALGLLQEWLSLPRLAAVPLVFVTEGAVGTGPSEAPVPALAAVWGLVRSAQSEHPGRFALVDLDGTPSSRAALPGALSLGEPQLALRDGALAVPRLVRQEAAGGGGPLAFDPEGTVLITGGTGGLGALVARHLVVEHGARRLLLASRRGPKAPGAEALAEELTALGAQLTVTACDLTDRQELAALLSTVPAEAPLTSVIHSAGVLDDGLVESLTPERLDRVLRPKVDMALLLDELTGDLPSVRSFVLFSSVAGTVGGPGQGNYAAANAFLDAFAAARIASGRPAVSLAWGLWEEASDMTRHLGGAGVAQLGRSGLAPLSNAEGLRLFDAVHGTDAPVLVPALLDVAALRGQAADDALPATLRALVPATAAARDPRERAARERLAAASGEERGALVRELVTEQVAEVLGHPNPGAVDQERAFQELGLDSLGAVRLRNRLQRTLGLPLPSTLAFQHPTVASLARHIASLVNDQLGEAGAADDGGAAGGAAVRAELDRLAGLLDAVPEDEVSAVSARLRSLLGGLERRASGAAPLDGDRLDAATEDEIFDLIDNDLGVS
uniref:SDR family NAD(P)-dependent oxidoreductase n=1 Tax=Streptomyces sp. NBRC 109706 TaxID=1550035 RepID=UPI000A78BD33